LDGGTPLRQSNMSPLPLTGDWKGQQAAQVGARRRQASGASRTCARRARPCHRRTAEQRDDIVPLHSITSSARASRDGGTFGPKNDGTYVVELRTAKSQALAISIPRTEAHVIRHFQERRPYGLFVPEVE
jgi:hypothetical protein